MFPQLAIPQRTERREVASRGRPARDGTPTGVRLIVRPRLVIRLSIGVMAKAKAKARVRARAKAY